MANRKGFCGSKKSLVDVKHRRLKPMPEVRGRKLEPTRSPQPEEPTSSPLRRSIVGWRVPTVVVFSADVFFITSYDMRLVPRWPFLTRSKAGFVELARASDVRSDDHWHPVIGRPL
jgi:hypothetical protein